MTADKILKQLSAGKIVPMKEIIVDINAMVDERKTLNKQIGLEIDKIETSMENMIKNLGTDVNLNDQLDLRRKLLDLAEFRMQENVNCFRDIAQLKKEMREIVQQVREREEKAIMLQDLM